MPSSYQTKLHERSLGAMIRRDFGKQIRNEARVISDNKRILESVFPTMASK